MTHPRIVVTAKVPGVFRATLGTWTSGREDSHGRVSVVESFPTHDHQEAKALMVRLLAPLGVRIFAMSSVLTEEVSQ